MFRARALSRTLTALYEEELRPLGLKASQMSVMTAVAVSGEERLSALADRIALEPSSLSRILDVMRRNGWVETVTDPDDERARLVRMTDAGNALYAEACPLWRKAQARARKLLGRRGAETFAELANRSLSRRAP
jgi:DNA-binding MarR family transcriptional regulator